MLSFKKHILQYLFLLAGCLFCTEASWAQLGGRFTENLEFVLITANGNASPALEAGGELVFSVTVRNNGTAPFQNCELHVTTIDPYVTFHDSTESFDYIAPGNQYALNNCASCQISPDIPDGRVITFAFLITNNTETAIAYRSYRVQACALSLTDYAVIDNGNRNGLVNSNETDTLLFIFHNEGTSEIHDIVFSLQTNEPGVQVVSAPMLKDVLYGDETFNFSAVISTNTQFVDGHTLDVEITAVRQSSGAVLNRQFVSIVGISNCTDFANGTMPSEMYGEGTQVGWFLDNTNAHSDLYSLRSGVITHYDSSTVNMPVSILHDGEISFMYKVSSESNYDWLYFYIDGVQKARWSGQVDWAMASYPILTGNHILTWRYIKDKSVNTGSDCAWIDDICLSNYNEELPQLSVTPDRIDVVRQAEESPTFEQTLHFSNESNVYLLFANELCDEDNNPVGWVSVATPNGSVNAHQSRDITLNFNTSAFFAGDYATALRITVDGLDTTIVIPITLQKTAGIDDRTMADPMLRIYPNPTQGLVTLESEHAQMEIVIIRDLSGRMLKAIPCEGLSHPVNLSDFAPGLYLLQVRFQNGKTSTLKVVKQ